MMNQETCVKVHELRRQGWTLDEIAAETGFHPSTISEHLKAEGPPARRQVPDAVLVMNARWKARTAELVTVYPRLLGVSVFNKLRAENFAGGYSTVTRELREIRGPGSGRPRRCRCRSTPTRARKPSSISATCLIGRPGGGGRHRCGVSG